MKTTIELMVEDGNTLNRMYEKGWINYDTFLKFGMPLLAEIEVYEGLARMEATLRGPRYSLSGVIEEMAMRQLVSTKEGSYVL